MTIALKRWLISAGLIAGLTATIHAQQFDLQGKVVDQKGGPVAGAQLKLAKMNVACTTDVNGIFRMKTVGVNFYGSNRSHEFIKISRNFLELGNSTDAAITVFSINGAILNRVVVNNQPRISINKLVPSKANSQAVIISVVSEGRKINFKSIKCEDEWLSNNNDVIKTSQGSLNKHAAATVVDTLSAKKDGKQTAHVLITNLIATLPDIVLVDDSVSSMSGDVKFSVPSKTFKSNISVTMSTTTANASIRYTTNGLAPTATSTLYSGSALTFTQTTQLRAAVFVDDIRTGRPSTAIYIARDFDYTSSIPIVILDGYGKGKPASKYHFLDVAFMTFEPVNGVASLDNPPTLVSRAGYHLRGQSSMMMFEQAPYRIELWDDDNKDVDYQVLGMPASSDWSLLSVCTDNSLIRNVLGFDMGKAMGLATVQYRWAEVFVKYSTGGVLKSTDYQGIYNMVQPIKIAKNTMNLKKLKSDDTDPEKITGGYIFKFDQMVDDSGAIKLECTGAKKITEASGIGYPPKVDSTATCWDDLELVEPSEPNTQQIAYITKNIQDFHNALHAKPAGDWKKYVDMNSFVNIHILNEITRNVDSWVKSHYMYKDRGGLITAGPVWDYNFAMGNFTEGFSLGGYVDPKAANPLNKWQVETERAGSGDWHLMMWKQPEFKTAFKARYNELRGSALSDAGITKLIDDCKKPIASVAQRNFTAYRMGDCIYDTSTYKSMFKQTIKDSTWTGQVDSLKKWTIFRMKKLDSLVKTLP
jgi:hypothetical protein